MNVSIRQFGWSAVALLGLVGCETSPTPPPPPTAPTPAEPGKNDVKAMPVDPAKPDAKGAASTPAAKLSDAEIAEIKKLPADEQPIALKQMVCPVSDSNLGSMDKPIKQVVDNQTFFLCCENCVAEVKKNPATVLARLKK